jgi:hypothetical protein
MVADARLVVSLEAQVAKMQKDVAATQAKFNSAMQSMTASGGQFEKSVSAANRNVGASFRQFGRNAEVAKFQTANLAAQFQDIAVQLQSGTSPLTVALQQGTQISAVLGPMGARGSVAALGGAFMSLINPVSLATIAFIGLGGVAVQYLTELLSAGESTEATMQKQAELIQTVAARWGDAVPALREYADELNRLRESTENQQAVQSAINQLYEQTRASLPELSAGFAEVASQMLDMGGRAADVKTLQLAIEDLTAKTESGDATAEEMEQSVSALASALASSGVPAAASMIDIVDSLSASFLNAAKSASAMREQAALATSMAGLGALGTLSPIRSGGGKFLNEQEALEFDAANRKSLFQLEQERGSGGSSRSAGISEAQRERDAIATLIEQMEFERSLIGMTALEKEKANALRRAGAGATAEEKARILDLVEATYQQTEALKAMEQAQKDAAEAQKEINDAAREFAGDIVQALMNGESAADALANALQKVADKLLNEVLDALFQVNSAGGGGGGILGFLTGLLGLGGGIPGFGGTPLPGPFPAAPVGIRSGAISARSAGVMSAAGAGRSSGGVQEIRVVGVFVDDGGVVKGIARNESSMVTREGIKRYDETGKQRFGRDANESRKRGFTR